MLKNKQPAIGFMQGRLSPLVNGKIQAFPWNHWKDEFSIAYENGFKIMEWTLDQDRLYENPFMTEKGQSEIKKLSYQYGKKNIKFKKVNESFLNNLSILNGQALHAKSLGFIHPTNNKLVNFQSELPNDFKKMLDLLKKLSS